MPQSKTILILANSIKKSARCIAGRELLVGATGVRVGSWIRPISDHGEGELTTAESARIDRTQVRVLDVATVQLHRCLNDICQPENWLIAGPRPWNTNPLSAPVPPLAGLEEDIRNPWLQKGQRTDRIAHDFLIQQPAGFSICIIRPERLKLEFWTEFNQYKNRDQPKSKAFFRYRNVDYALSLTDPLAIDRFRRPDLRTGDPKHQLPLKSGALLICVSLTPPFQGYHYKVVATILGI